MEKTMAVQGTRGVLLGSTVLLLVFLEGLQACGQVAVASTNIQYGSIVTATCTVSPENCPMLKGVNIHILWKLNDHNIPGSQSGSTKEVQSSVTISRFSMPEGNLSCYVAGNRSNQLIDRVHIRAGYPPSTPKELLCVMNVTEDILTCTWDSGQETNIDTEVTLEIYRNRGGQCGHPQDRKGYCVPEKGRSSCTIPRNLLNLYQKMDMWVKVNNSLGSAKSESLCLDPMDAVKLDPPTIHQISSNPSHPGCLILNVTKSADGYWINQWFELRYRKEQDTEWNTVTNITSPVSSPFLSRFLEIKQCGFHNFLNYHFQIRSIKESLRGYWSEWSHVKHFLTPEAAPTGRLDVWWKALGSVAGTKVQLMWKPMSKEEARGQILRYLVFYFDGPKSKDSRLACNTTEELCHFLLPSEITSVSIKAENAAGLSHGTNVTLLHRTGPALPRVWAYPRDEQSLWAEWDAPKASVNGYILEWCRVTEEGPCNIQWQRVSNATCRSSPQEGIEPFTLFKVLLYPLYQDAVGLPVQTEAYSKEKAPSRSPKLQLKAIGMSHAELMWEPVPLEQRNGFITNYTIYWQDAQENIFFSVVAASSRRFVIEDLAASSTYKVHLMSSTRGGSTNGTILTLQTRLLDDVVINILCILCAVCVLAFCLLFIIYQKKNEMKTRFWPNVPDPANSISGKWIPESLQEETKVPWDLREVQHDITCDITILEKQAATQKIKATKHFQDPLKSLFQEHNGARSPSYVNTADSVQYAKVIVGSYRGQHVPAPIYVRSNSTQPLLGDMTPSPKPYENLWFHGTHRDEAGSSKILEDAIFNGSECLMDFPLLQGLKIEGSEDLSDFSRFPTVMQNRE